jgi:hypothetical protein
MKNGENIAAITAVSAVATSTMSLGDWASIISMVAAVFSIGLSLVSALRNFKQKETE